MFKLLMLAQKFFKPAVIASLLLAFSSAPLSAQQEASPSANTAGTSAYEALLEKYYNMRYGDENVVPGLIKSYRGFANKTDSRFSYMESPQFMKAAGAKFKETFKENARRVLTQKELEFMMVYLNSKTKASLDEVARQVMDISAMSKLFDSIPVPAASKEQPPVVPPAVKK